MPPRPIKLRRELEQRAQKNREKTEDSLVNMIDASRMFKVALDKIKSIQSRPDYWTNKKLIKEVDIIKTAMWQVWSTKELEEGLYRTVDGKINAPLVVPILKQAKEDTSRVMQMEISGPDGGPLEMVRRLNKEDLDRLAPFAQMIKAEQKERLIPMKVVQEK